jgi:hypothetical protein
MAFEDRLPPLTVATKIIAISFETMQTNQVNSNEYDTCLKMLVPNPVNKHSEQ